MESVLNPVSQKKNPANSINLIVIESDDTEPETVNEETANETEVETEKSEKTEEGEEPEPPKFFDKSAQAVVEAKNAKTETSCPSVGSGLDQSISKKGLPVLVESIKNAFIDGGYDPRAWDQMTLDSTPVANFADVLYIQVRDFSISGNDTKRRVFLTPLDDLTVPESGRV